LINSSENDDSTNVKIYSYEEGLKNFNTIPSYLPNNKPFRWVKLMRCDFGCPCGGTHVEHIKDIKNFKINKITNKGKVVRVSYNVI
jgi:Ser-tRNA(Ala) deacylase AlaX